MANEVSKVNVTTTNTAPAAKPVKQLKSDTKMEIREGMRIADVNANGSQAQKLVAPAFEEKDYNYETGVHTPLGTISKDDAEAMNDYTFALDGNELRAYNNRTGCNVFIKTNNIDELKEYAGFVREAENFEGGTIVLDAVTRTATYDGVSGDVMTVSTGQMGYNTFNIKNSSLKTINAVYPYNDNLKLNIKNTKNVGMIFDSPTELMLQQNQSKGPVLNCDDDSKIEIKYYRAQ